MAYDVDVLVSGGGPVGLMVAVLLTRSGFSVRVVEAETSLSQDLRASTFHPPTLDLLDGIGIGQTFVAKGLICPHWQIRMHPTGERAVFDMSVLQGETEHPYRLQCEQWKLSQMLLGLLPEGTVSFGTELESFSQDELGVSATCNTSGERSSVRARFVVGADGARSMVRKALDAAFDGQTYPETTLLVTTQFAFEDHLEGLSNVSYCWKDGGNFSLLKVPGRWRVSLYPREDMSIEAQMEPAAIDAALQVIVPRTTAYEVLEQRPYRVHQRIVERYNHGRVVLAGDAAHLNSPAGGMGLNGGLHDAFALAGALGDILSGRASNEERLALYDRQRRPVAKDQILAQADRNRARMREREPERRRIIMDGLKETTSDRVKLKAYLMKSSMIEGLRQAASIT
jgi:2-polyprenyl-6-methoxyphenol hydroxylase-like FAD-dependent oxidoreductase